MCLERFRSCCWDSAAVQLVDQPVRRDDLTAVEQQDREERSLSGAAELEGSTVVENLQWAEDPELHCHAATGCNPRTASLQPACLDSGRSRVAPGGPEKRRRSCLARLVASPPPSCSPRSLFPFPWPRAPPARTIARFTASAQSRTPSSEQRFAPGRRARPTRSSARCCARRARAGLRPDDRGDARGPGSIVSTPLAAPAGESGFSREYLLVGAVGTMAALPRRARRPRARPAASAARPALTKTSHELDGAAPDGCRAVVRIRSP